MTAPDDVVLRWIGVCLGAAGAMLLMGFCTEEQSKKFLKSVPLFEQAMVESGIV